MYETPERNISDRARLADTIDEERERIVEELRHQHYPTAFNDQIMDTLAELSRIARERGIDGGLIESVIAELVWNDRAAGLEHNDIEYYQCIMSRTSDLDTYLPKLIYHYVLGRLRCDFKFASMMRALEHVPREYMDQQLAALRIFAKMGLHQADALAQYYDFRDTHECDRSSFEILLQALWFGTHIETQGTEMIVLSDEMLKYNLASPNLYYWRAFAYRRLERFDEARKAILEAIEILPADKNDVHQDYSRERELIESSVVLHAQLDDKLKKSIEELGKRASNAERTVAQSTYNLVEILSLFTALIGFFAAGGVTIFNGGLILWQRIILLALVFIGAIGFIFAAHFIVRIRPKDVWSRDNGRDS